MVKKIRIFIGSSINEFQEERQDLADYIYFLRGILEANNSSIGPIPELCEFEDTALSSNKRKQDDFNELIDRSDICIFMFGNKAGHYSVEELLTALARVKVNGTDIPEIDCFFRDFEEGEDIDRMVHTLRILLDEKYVRYSDKRSFFGNIKLRVVQRLAVLAKDMFPVSIAVEEKQDGMFGYSLRLEGERILDLDETNLFETDDELRKARADYEKEADVSRKNDIRIKLENMVGTRLGLA